MNVFSKYLLRSMAEKKGRTLLLLLSITISAALLVASLGTIKAVLSTLTSQVKGNLGDFNVQITPSKDLDVPLFDPNTIQTADIKNSFKGINFGGFVSDNPKKEFSITGTTLTDFKHYRTMQIVKKQELEPFTGRKLIISQNASKKLNVKLGEQLKLTMLGKEASYQIAAISTNKGLFFGEKDNRFTFVTPEENIFSVYGVQHQYSMMLASVKKEDLGAWIKKFNQENSKNHLVASQTYDEKSLEDQLNMIRMPLFFMLGIVLLMTTFIIYSSFKLIIMERLSVIGVFLSQGATKGGIIKILVRESLAYGLAGGILGDLLGAGLTGLISYFANPLKEYGVKATTEFYPPYFIIGFIFAILLSTASTLIPILSIRKLPVKDVILNTISTSNKISLKSFIAGLILIAAAAIFHFTGAKSDYIAAIPALFLGFIGVIMVIPKLVDFICDPLVKILRNTSGLSVLSLNNVRTSKVLVNNIRLIAVSVISIVMITSISVSITEVVQGAYDGMNFDVLVSSNSNFSKNIDEIIHGYEGVDTIYQDGMIMTQFGGDEAKIINVVYVDPEKYKTFENYTVFEKKDKQLDELKGNDDGIMIAKQISVRYNIKKGDTITLSTADKKESFQVLSIFNPKMMYNGNYNLISSKAALKHFEVKYPNQYYLLTKGSADEAKTALEKKLKGLGVTTITKVEMAKRNKEGNKQMTNVLGIFSYITMVIGAFGIIGNVSISFLQRKRDIAVMSSVGLSKGGRSFMILLEGAFQALLGLVISLVAAWGINLCLEDIFKFLTIDLELVYPYKSVGAIVLATLALMLFTSLSALFKSKRLQIVQELKYE